MANEFIPVNLSELENFAPVNLKQIGIRDYSDIKRQEVALAAAQKKQQLDPNRLPDTIEEYKLAFPTATPEQLQNYVYTKQEQAKQRQIDEVHQQGIFKDTSAMDYPVSFASGVIETASVIPLLGDMALRAATAGNYSLDELLEDTTGLPQNSSIKKDLQSALHDQLSEKAQLEDQEKQLKNELFNIRRDQRLQMSADEGYGDLHANAAEFMAEVKDSLINIGEAGPESVAREVAKNLPNLLGAELTAMKGAALTKTIVEKAVTHKLAAKYGDEAAEKIKKGTERFMASKAGIGKVQTGATAGAIASMMAMEGGSNAQEAGQQIRELSSAELRATKGYQEMQKANPKMSEGDIRLALANKAEEITLAVAGSTAAIPATLMGRFLGRTAAAPISKATIGSAVKATLEGGVRETLEETGQGFSGGVSKNYAGEKVLNREDFSEMTAKELLAGVGRETAESAVAGFGAGTTFAGTAYGSKYLLNKAGQAQEALGNWGEERLANKILTENSPAQKAGLIQQEYVKANKGTEDNLEAKTKARQDFIDRVQPVMDQFDTELVTAEEALQKAQDIQKQWEDRLATLDKEKNPAEHREATKAIKKSKRAVENAAEVLDYTTATQNGAKKSYENILATEIKTNFKFDVDSEPEQVILSDKTTPAMKKLAVQKILGIKTFGTHGTNEEKAAQQKLLNDMLDNPDIASDGGIKQRINSKLKLIQYYEDIRNGAAPDMTDANQDTVNQDILAGNEKNKFLGVNEYILDIRGAIASKNKNIGNKLMRGLVNLRVSRDIKVDLASQIHAIAQSSPDDATFKQNAGELIKQYQARFPGAKGQLFNIHRNTFNTLLPKMQTERDLIIKAENELQQEAKAVFKMPLAAQAYSGTQRRFTPSEDTAETKQAQAEAQQAPVDQEYEVAVDEQEPEEAPVYDNYNPMDEGEQAPEAVVEEKPASSSQTVRTLRASFDKYPNKKDFIELVKSVAAGQPTWTAERKAAFIRTAEEMVEQDRLKKAAEETVTTEDVIEEQTQEEVPPTASEATAEAKQDTVAKARAFIKRSLLSKRGKEAERSVFIENAGKYAVNKKYDEQQLEYFKRLAAEIWDEVNTSEQSTSQTADKQPNETLVQEAIEESSYSPAINMIDRSLIEELDWETPIEKSLLWMRNLPKGDALKELIQKMDYALSKTFPNIKVNWNPSKRFKATAVSKAIKLYKSEEIAKAMKLFEYLQTNKLDRGKVRELLELPGLKTPYEKHILRGKVRGDDTFLVRVAKLGGLDISKLDISKRNKTELAEIKRIGNKLFPGYPLFPKVGGISLEDSDTLRGILQDYFPDLDEDGYGWEGNQSDTRIMLSTILDQIEGSRYGIGQTYAEGTVMFEAEKELSTVINDNGIYETDSEETQNLKQKNIDEATAAYEKTVHDYYKKSQTQLKSDKVSKLVNSFTYSDGEIFENINTRPLGEIALEYGYQNEKEMLTHLMEVLELTKVKRTPIVARNILIGVLNEKLHTLPTEFAYHYLLMFYDSPIVQKALIQYGGNVNSQYSMLKAAKVLSTEIGKQSVAQKGKALNTWNSIVTWVLDMLSRKEITQILTDSFLKGKNLNKRFKYVDTIKANPDEIQFGLENSLRKLITRFQPKGLFSNTPSLRVSEIELASATQEQKEFLNGVKSFTKRFGDTFTENIKPLTEGKNFIQNAIRYQPASLFTDESGSFHPWFTEMVGLASYEWLATLGPSTLQNDLRAIRRILGLPQDAYVSDEQHALFQYAGANAEQAAEAIGAIVLRNLGISFNTSTASYQYHKDVAKHIGAAALIVLSKTSITEQSNQPTVTIDATKATNIRGEDGRSIIGVEGVTMRLVRANAIGQGSEKLPDAELEKLNNDIKTHMDLFESLTSTDMEQIARHKPVKPLTEIKLGLRKASKKAVATVNALNSNPYYIQQELMKLYSSINESDVNDILGIDSSLESDIHIDSRKGVHSRNLSIKRVREKLAAQISSMQSNAERWVNGIESPIYLNHTISDTDRFFIDSPLNPQTSKIIRHLLTKKERTSTIDLTNSNSNELDLFKFAVLEAFGEKVNKITPANARVKFEQLLNDADTQEAIREIEKVLESGATNIAAPTLAKLSKDKENLWTTSAVLALSKYQTAIAKQEKSFQTDLYIQFDGTTNGYFFSIFLMALGRMSGESESEALHRIKTMAQKTGVFTSDSGYRTVNDYKQNPANNDIYEERANMFISAIKSSYAAEDIIQVLETLFSPFGKPWTDTNGVTSSGRNLVKDAVTKLIYAAGPGGISFGIRQDAVENLTKKIQQIALGEVDASKKDEIIQLLERLAEIHGVSVDTSQLRNKNGKELLEVSLKSFELLFATTFNSMGKDASNVGTAVEILIKEQNPIMHRNKNEMVKAVRMIFDKFAFKMQEELEKAATNSEGKIDPLSVTEDMLMEVFNRNMDTAPIFHTANSEDITERYTSLDFNRLTPTPEVEGEQAPNKGWKALLDIGRVGSRVVLHEGQTYEQGIVGSNKAPEALKVWSHGFKPIAIKLPSVSVMPGLTQSTDAATISKPLTEMSALGLHDGLVIGILQAVTAGKMINDSAIEMITKYSSFESVMNRFKEIFSAEIKEFYDLKEVKDNLQPNGDINSYELSKETKGSIGYFYHINNARVVQHNKLKEQFIPAIARSAQYNPHIEEATYTPAKAPVDLPPAAPLENKRTTMTPAGVEAAMAELAARDADKNIKGSSQEGVDESLFNNSSEKAIDHNNVIKVFDGLANEGNIIENSNHANYLRSLISEIYAGSMGVLQMATETFGDTTKAVINLADKKIKLQLASKATMNSMMMGGIRMSAQQAYTHELTHNHMAHAIDNDTTTARQARLLFKKAEENVTWEDFITPGATPTAEEIIMAKNTYDYIFRNEASFRESTDYLYQTPYSERNAYLHEFAAFGLTNENFIRKLKTIKLTRKDLVSDKVGASNKNVFTKLVEMISEHFNRLRLKLKGESLDATTDVHAELYRLAKELSETNEKHGFKIFEKISAANDYTAKYTKAVASAIWENDSKTVTAMKKGLEDYLMKTSEIGEFYRGTMNEITGSKIPHRVYEWIARINSKNLEQRPIHQSKHIAEVIEKQFAEGVLTEQTRRAIHRALIVTDLSALMVTSKDVMDKHFTWTKIKEILTDVKALDTEIAALEKEIRKVANAYESNFIEAQAQSLGAFLATGMTTEQYTLRSLESIVSAHPKLLETASRLVSLQTLKYTDQQSKGTLAGMIDTSQEALEFTINTHAALKAVAAKHAPDNSKFKLKGALQDTLNHYKDIQVFSSAMEPAARIQERINRLTTLNYVKIREDKISFVNNKGENEVTTVQVYGSPFNPRSTFDTGAIAYRNPDKQNKDYVGSINIKQEIIAQRSKGKQNSVPKHHTIADNRGDIAAAHLMYSVGEETLRTHLDKQENFSRTLGQLGAVVSSEITTVKANRFLSKEWAKEIKENIAKEPGKYLVIPVGEDATQSNIPLYKKVQKEYLLLPPHLKAAMSEDGIVDEEGNLTIHKEAVKLLFAQSRLSPLNLELKQKDFDADKANEYLGKLVNNGLYHLLYNKPGLYAFRGWEETVSYAKGTIVIKGIEVLIHNITSNNISLLLLGVGFKDLIKWQHEGYHYAKEYQFLKKQVTQMELEMKIDNKKNTKEARIQLSRLKNRIASNPTRELFELGAFSAISEEIYTLNEDSPFKGIMEEKIAKITAPIPKNNKAVEAFKIATFQRGTIGYQATMDLTQMSDFVARYVLWKHLTERKGVSKDQAIHEVMDTFVMYDTVTNKWIQLGNDVGLIMFTKFWLRTQRVIKKAAVENPVNLALYLLAQYMFFDTTDILDSFLFNMPEVNTPWGVVSSIVTEQPLVKLLF